MAQQLTIGVLALQGDFARHRAALERCGGARDGGAAGGDAAGVTSIEVRKPEQLEAVDGLVIPGGESTTLLKLMDVGNFVPTLEKFHAAGKPIFGTCAGLILLARDVVNPRQFSLGFIDVGVERNAYGRQRESFETQGTARLGGAPTSLEMVFIRAPRIRRVGQEVETLATHGDEPVMARQDGVLVATFHPELTADTTVHRYFCEMVRRRREERP